PPPGAVRRLEERLALLTTYARPLLEGEAISSHRPIVGRLVVAWKRFTRFWIRRYTDTIFLRQQMFNEEVSHLLQELTEEVRALREEIESHQPQGE
ncbi:hypothetical protein JXA47_15890, partial [Candidatus Sumerlaeota bacterium]|nr:hypothetical protein [Candidatus Sumerlaeota bacterium]